MSVESKTKKPVFVGATPAKVHLVENLYSDSGEETDRVQAAVNMNGHDGGSIGAEADMDPEMEAEREYALQQSQSLPVSRNIPVRNILIHRPKSLQDQVQVNGMVQVTRGEKNQRKSRAGRGRGNAKKEGAGGKYTWGVASKVYEELELDPNDPNYDSDAQANMTFEEEGDDQAKVSLDLLDKYIEPIILELYCNGDGREAVGSIGELGLSAGGRSRSVRLLLSLALDHGNDARELTSQLLADLVHRRLFTHSDVAEGILALVKEDLADLAVDCPMAAELMGNFIARAIADLALPSDFLDTAEKSDIYVSTPYTTESLERAQALIIHKEQLHDIWGVGGGRRPVRFLSKQMQTILQEYLANGDEKEASRCLRELEVPHFSHEFVYQAGIMALESMHQRSIDLLALLLKHLFEKGQLTALIMEKGFTRLYANLHDLSLDLPPAYTLADCWTKAALNAKFISQTVADRLPRKGRKRILSEGDDGKYAVADIVHPYI